MQITEIKVIPLSVPEKENKLRLGIGYLVKKDIILVKIKTDAGYEGIGQSHHAKCPEIVSNFINNVLSDLLIGRDPLKINSLWDLMYNEHVRSHGSGALAVTAMSGIDIALWDLKGKILNVSVSNLLGGVRNQQIKAYVGGITLAWQPEEDLIDEARTYLNAGYPALKLRLGRGIDTDINTVKAIRNAVGNKVKLMLDANCAYNNATEVLLLLKKIEEFEPAWLEEPFPPDRIGEYEKLVGRSTIPIAGGENLFTHYQYEPYFRHGCLQFVQPDVTKVGGITELIRIYIMAKNYGVVFAPHVYPAVIGLSATLQFLSTIPDVYYCEYEPGEHPFLVGLTEQIINVEDGSLNMLKGCGLGLDLKSGIEEKYPFIDGPTYKR